MWVCMCICMYWAMQWTTEMRNLPIATDSIFKKKIFLLQQQWKANNSSVTRDKGREKDSVWGIFPLLHSSNNLATRHREIKSWTDMEIPFFLVVSITSWSCEAGSQGEKNASMVLPTTQPCLLKYQPIRQDVPFNLNSRKWLLHVLVLRLCTGQITWRKMFVQWTNKWIDRWLS